SLRIFSFTPHSRPVASPLFILLYTLTIYQCGDHHDLHSFPTRRSSDLDEVMFVGLAGHAEIWDSATYDALEAETLTPEYMASVRSEEHTSELQSRFDLVCRLLLEEKK